MGKIDQVKLILDNVLPGIFCLSETFLNDKVDDRLLYHEGFELERKDRILKAGGGLLRYIQNDITYERRTVLEKPTIEIIWLEIKFATSKNLLVGSSTALQINTQNGSTHFTKIGLHMIQCIDN